MKCLAPEKHRRNPVGFTMVELLIVMGILVLIAGIAFSLVTGAVGTAREKATKATIRKVDGLLTQRMEAFTRAIADQNAVARPGYTRNVLLYRSAFTPAAITANLSPLQLAGGQLARAKVLGEKALFREGFPQSLDEVDSSLKSGWDMSKDDVRTQSSEAMFLFLTKMESFGAPAVDEDAFLDSEIADTDEDGLMEFVDGWGQPLRFYRWPTRLIRPGPITPAAQSLDSDGNYTIGLGPTAYNGQEGHAATIFFSTVPDATTLARDPSDPLGTTQKATWTYSDGSNTHNMTPAEFEQNFHLHTPDTWSLPLIVSTGEDNELGLHEVTEEGNFGHLAQPNYNSLSAILDNISNRNLQ